jgi:hypothetical protein
MCNQYKFPIFDPAQDSALIAKWLEATNSGSELHALMTDEFNQGFLIGRVLTMMEQQLDLEDEDSDHDEE